MGPLLIVFRSGGDSSFGGGRITITDRLLSVPFLLCLRKPRISFISLKCLFNLMCLPVSGKLLPLFGLASWRAFGLNDLVAKLIGREPTTNGVNIPILDLFWSLQAVRGLESHRVLAFFAV